MNWMSCKERVIYLGRCNINLVEVLTYRKLPMLEWFFVFRISIRKELKVLRDFSLTGERSYYPGFN